MKNTFKSNAGSIRKGSFVLVIFMLFIVACLFDFSKRSDINAQTLTSDHLKDVGIQTVYSIEERLNQAVREVDYASTLLTNISELSRSDTEVILQELKTKCKFDRIYRIDEKGSMHSLDHQVRSTSNGNYIEELKKGKKGISEEFVSSVTGEDVFAVYAPIMKDGKPAGGVVGILVVDHILDLITPTGFDGRSYAYILEPDGEVIMQAYHPEGLMTEMNFFGFLDTEADRVSVGTEEICKNMDEGKDGFVTYHRGDEKRTAYYAPVHVNDWYAVTAVSSKVTDRYVQSMDKAALHLTLKLGGAFVVIIILLVIWEKKIQRILLTSKDRTTVSDKKFELAIRHTSSILFEYYIEQDELVFISPEFYNYCKLPLLLPHVSDTAVHHGMVPPEYMPKLHTLFWEIGRKYETGNMEFKGGTAFPEDNWYRLSMTAIKNDRGMAVEAIGTLENITEKKRIEGRYVQEEQYRAAMLSEAIMVWSVDLVKQQILSYTVRGTDCFETLENKIYSSNLVEAMCKNIHFDDKERIKGLLLTENLMKAYYVGTKELKDSFRMKQENSNDYQWISCNISLLVEPTQGNPVVFAYTKNIDKEKRRELALLYRSERDPLTGLYNRLNMETQTNQALLENTTSQQLSCLMMMDLDGFKEVNDCFGHQAGDQLLKQVAEALLSIFRQEDLVARLGGDEFMVFVKNVTDEPYAQELAFEVCRQVRLINENDGNSPGLSISIGIAFAPKNGNEFELLYKEADSALYLAKQGGKNGFVVYTV